MFEGLNMTDWGTISTKIECGEDGLVNASRDDDSVDTGRRAWAEQPTTVGVNELRVASAALGQVW